MSNTVNRSQQTKCFQCIKREEVTNKRKNMYNGDIIDQDNKNAVSIKAKKFILTFKTKIKNVLFGSVKNSKAYLYSLIK